jgi:hypothetical protein
LRSFKARGSYSIVEAKFFPDLPAGERRAALRQAGLGEITIFEVLEVSLDELPNIERFCAPRASRQFGESPVNVRVEPRAVGDAAPKTLAALGQPGFDK